MTAAEIHARTLGRERFTILGLDLLPLTLGHVRILESLGCISPLNPGELGLACIVCSLPQREVVNYLQTQLTDKWLSGWRKSLGDWSFTEKADDFSDYLLCNTELPAVICAAGENETHCPIPAAQIIRVRLMAELGFCPESVDDMPFLQALWDITTLDVMRGRKTMFNQTESDIEERMASIDWESVERRGAILFSQPKAVAN